MFKIRHKVFPFMPPATTPPLKKKNIDILTPDFNTIPQAWYFPHIPYLNRKNFFTVIYLYLWADFEFPVFSAQFQDFRCNIMLFFHVMPFSLIVCKSSVSCLITLIIILKGVLHPWTLFLKTVFYFSQTKYQTNLIRNLPRNLKITVLFH